jgi:low temperature requirement protein LtrA
MIPPVSAVARSGALTKERGAVQIHVRLAARSAIERHRSSSQLELLFDLTFVVAIASITTQFAHAIAEGHAAAGIGPFLQVFFAIWWAWMNFTWFGSSYDTDDATSRVLTLVQMGGVLVLAAGVGGSFVQGDYTLVTVGYLIMRAALLVQWLRAAADNPGQRGTALRFATGIAILQVAWVARLGLIITDSLPAQFAVPTFVLLAVGEMLVPLWAQRNVETEWHPHHIAERYGLFVIILLGESVLASSNGVRASLSASGASGSLVLVAVSGLVLLFALWWLYFLEPAGFGLENNRARSYLWGYGHYGIFAALAALASGLEVAIGDTSHLPARAVGFGIAIPVSAFLVLAWLAHRHISTGGTTATRGALILPAAAAILMTPLAADSIGVPAGLAIVAGICVILVAASLLMNRRR